MTRPTVTILVPDGYNDADEFLKDCAFERAPEPELPSPEAMRDLVSAIIQDDAVYDPVTNTWDTSKAAAAIFTAFENA